MDPREGKEQLEALVAAVKAAIDEADPMGLLARGAPQDEYAPEVRTIVPRAVKARDEGAVQRILWEEFAHWFGPREAGSEAGYEKPAKAIWGALQELWGPGDERESRDSDAS